MKHKVEVCYQCPMASMDNYYSTDCQHPGMPKETNHFEYQSAIPSFCPLRDGAVVIRLKEKQ